MTPPGPLPIPSLPGSWVRDAACTNEDPELFFTEDSGRAGTFQSEVAKGICRSCPVRLACLQHALKAGEMYGIWGGTTAWERRTLRYTPSSPFALIAYADRRHNRRYVS